MSAMRSAAARVFVTVRLVYVCGYGAQAGEPGEVATCAS